jgi:hypothetical protein
VRTIAIASALLYAGVGSAWPLWPTLYRMGIPLGLLALILASTYRYFAGDQGAGAREAHASEVPWRACRNAALAVAALGATSPWILHVVEGERASDPYAQVWVAAAVLVTGTIAFFVALPVWLAFSVIREGDDRRARPRADAADVFD